MPTARSPAPRQMASSPPTPTALVTSLLSTLASISASTSTHLAARARSTTTTITASTSNAPTPAQILPESTRPLLVTLHVLFPHALLDALDLLDRGLVVKVVVRGDSDDTVKDSSVAMTKWRVLSSQTTSGSEYRNGDYHGRRGRRDWNGSGSGYGNGDGNGDRGTSSGRWRDRGHGYSTQYRRHDNDENNDGTEIGDPRTDLDIDMGMGTATSYTVALQAWNCSCPAFAFAAFTGGGAAASASLFANSVTTSTTRGQDTGHGNAQPGRDDNMATDMDVDVETNVDTEPATDFYSASAQEAPRTADWARKEALWQRLHQPQGQDGTDGPVLPFGGLAVSSTSTSAATATNPLSSNHNPLDAITGPDTLSLPSAPSANSPPQAEALPPTCKHLLAALLASKCPELFGPHLQSRSGGGKMGMGRRGVVLRELRGSAEAAGWAS